MRSGIAGRREIGEVDEDGTEDGDVGSGLDKGNKEERETGSMGTKQKGRAVTEGKEISVGRDTDHCRDSRGGHGG